MRTLVPLLLTLSLGCVSQASRSESPRAPDASVPTEYTACGCGCCPGVEPRIQCLGGESLQEIIARDKAAAASPDCAMAGCSIPVKYQSCDETPRAP